MHNADPTPESSQILHCDAAVIGAGPAGLMAAEVLAAEGAAVHVFDAMASAGRKFLLAGKGGLNLTHAEPPPAFAARYGARSTQIEPLLQQFGAQQLRDWAHALGVETFVGSSGRVFPIDMKAAPLLRAWLQRLRQQGVQFHMRHRWQGWAQGGALRFSTPSAALQVRARAVVLALGGASWPQLGSDGAWAPLLAERGVDVVPLQPANCGFDTVRPDGAAGWTPLFAERFAGQPFKSVAVRFEDHQGRGFARKGEFVATATGVEGSLVYAFANLLRDEISARGQATFWLDLLPNHDAERVAAEVLRPRGSRSLSSHLKGRLGLDGIKAAVLFEQLGRDGMHDGAALARAIKALPVTVVAPRPVAEAISTAGGVAWDVLDAHAMLKALPGVFCAGEMLDWEAPTGGYLLTACCAQGRAAGQGALRWLAQQQSTH